MNSKNPAPEEAQNEAQLDLVIAAYLQQRERGEAPDPQSFLRRHPQLAAALQPFFTADARLQNLAPAEAQNTPTILSAGEPCAGEEILGKYRLLERIGEGGMGAVWLAQQRHPVRRQVAIKLIRAGMDSRQVLARFDAERQALALMDHPHIARVLDGGVTERGRPFFVMEYIKGLPLTEYCDRAQLSLKERLQLFIPVCQAVQHAHLKGIVHRDLKPSNILVCLYDGRAVPKVIDFGLARALHHDLTDLTLHTAHGQMVGTPVYMSPEQAEFNNLDIDTRSDVYSLGVVLYELLTGFTPLDRHRLQKAAWDEMLRLIREEDPLPPSTRVSGSERLPGLAAQRRMDPRLLQRSLAGELDWIVMRALEKERSRRYETSSDLGRDIERYLADEPVEACPPSRLYRWRKFIRRHRPQLLACGILLLGLNAAIAGLVWGWQQSRQAEEQVRQTLRELLKERAAKDQAVADGQQERARSRSKRAQAIITAITEAAGKGVAEEKLPSGTLRALRQSFQAWSQIADDAERVDVLDVGLTTPAEALILASHHSAVLQACVGISRERRQHALQLLLEKQRCSDCAAEVRAAACLLTLALGHTDVPAFADAAQIFLSGKRLREEFEQQLWRRLPAFSDGDREAPFQLLLNSPVRFESSADRQLDVPDEVRRLHLLGRIPCAADWYACLDPPAVESWSPDLVNWSWSRLIRNLKTGAAVVPADTKNFDAALRGSHFLCRLVPALPKNSLASASRDMLDLLEASLETPPNTPPFSHVSRDWMTALLKRLGPEHFPAIIERLQVIFSRRSSPQTLQIFTLVLDELLPQMNPPQRHVISSLLFAQVLPATAWDDRARQMLSWTLGLAVQDLPATDVEAFLQPFRSLPDGEAKVRATELLVYVLHRHSPQLSPEAAANWNSLLWQSLHAVAAHASASTGTTWSGIPATLEVLAPRVPAADWNAAEERFKELTQASAKPLTQDPFFLDTATGLAPWLPPQLRSQLRTALLAEVPGAAPPVSESRPVPETAPQQAAPSTALPASELFDRRSTLLAALVRHPEASTDTELLQQLQKLLETSKEPGQALASIAPALQQLLIRCDSTVTRQLWSSVLAALKRETWGLEYDRSGGLGHSFTVDPARLQIWQQKTGLLTRHVTPLLGTFAERLPAEDAGAAWKELLDLLRIPAPEGIFTQWDHTRAELCTVALRTLASRIPEAEVSRHLQELICTAHYDLDSGTSILSPFSSRGCDMFHAALQALTARLTPDSSRETATWLMQNSTQHSPVILSLTWQAVIPRLDALHRLEFEEHLFLSAMVPGGPGMGPLPWRDLCLGAGPEIFRKRWQDILRLLRTSADRETTEQLCELLMACVDHVPAAEREQATAPLLAHLENACRLPEASEKQASVLGIQHFRSIRRLRPEASIQDAVIRLARALDPAPAKLLAKRCLEVALNSAPDEDWWLPFREENFPGAVCGTPEQLVVYFSHPNCSGWLGESLLRQFEELTLHGGQPVLRNASAGTEVLVVGPDALQRSKRVFLQGPPDPWPEWPARRFRDVAEVTLWIANNSPEWLGDLHGTE